MYKHADQTWKNKPLFLSEQHQELFIQRLEEYIPQKKLEKILVIYHGGEPLLFGTDRIIQLSERIKTRMGVLHCQVDFGIQTNGLLLTEAALEKFQAQDISVSLSIDGPEKIHNRFRLDHKGKPSFDKVHKALLLLKKFPKVFSGCIAVINPYFKPRELFEFFDQNGVTEFNILLPDANYIAEPMGRYEQPDLYKNWLIKAFDCWFDEFPQVKCKFFESILMSFLGQKGQSDAFGLGDISMVTIETDGTYHDLDVLKITEEYYSSLGMDLENHPLIEVEKCDKLLAHSHLLTKEGLSNKCLSCPHVDVCGGGSVPHRYSREGYKNPTIYCDEMYSLISHMLVRFNRLIEQERQQQGSKILDDFDHEQMKSFWSSNSSSSLIESLKDHIARKDYARLQSVFAYALKRFPEKETIIEQCRKLSYKELKPALLWPTTHAWIRALSGQSTNTPAKNIDEKELLADPDYFDDLLSYCAKSDDLDFVIQDSNRWYSYSLGNNILIQHSPSVYEEGLQNLKEALHIIEDYNTALYREILQVSRHILLVKDATAHPDKDVSFSDETLPGALFIGVWKNNGLLSPYMVAASLIHEHLHQKLYLLQQRFELFLPQETLVYSPWPQKLRPPSGALHAVYVFTHVAAFWSEMLHRRIEPEMATIQFEMDLEKLEQCINEIKEKVAFTSTGLLFFNRLLIEYQSVRERAHLQMV